MDELKRKAASMRKHGKSYAVIGAKLGFHANTIRRWLTQRGRKEHARAEAKYRVSEKGIAARKRARQAYDERQRVKARIGEAAMSRMME